LLQHVLLLKKKNLLFSARRNLMKILPSPLRGCGEIITLPNAGTWREDLSHWCLL